MSDVDWSEVQSQVQEGIEGVADVSATFSRGTASYNTRARKSSQWTSLGVLDYKQGTNRDGVPYRTTVFSFAPGMVIPTDYVPAEGDTVNVDGRQWTVKSVGKNMGGTLVLSYDLELGQ